MTKGRCCSVELDRIQVYYIAKASLKAANRQYNTLNNDYEMTFNHDTHIEACDAGEGQNIPQVQFNFTPIDEIANKQANSVCGTTKTNWWNFSSIFRLV